MNGICAVVWLPQNGSPSLVTNLRLVFCARSPPSKPNRLDKAIKDSLLAKGIKTLFPIQSACLDFALAGNDVVGRARTGCGKTLAFVLPIVQSLLTETGNGRMRRPAGRPPAVIVLAPTRELAKQVGADFEHVGAAAGLSTLVVYGGAPYGPQEGSLRRGVDVVVGTPGRIKDHLEKGTLKLTSLRFRVLVRT